LNIWGWGDWSPILWVNASSYPADVAKPVTSIDSATGGVLVQWAAPNDRSSAINRYKVELYNKQNNTWLEDLSHCDGRQTKIVTSRSCIVPMNVFTDASFGY
jgi:hypothetical protein